MGCRVIPQVTGCDSRKFKQCYLGDGDPRSTLVSTVSVVVGLRQQPGSGRCRMPDLRSQAIAGQLPHCYGWAGGAAPPICVPITSPEIMISTRRFCWRPSTVSLLATGFDFPKPAAVIEAGSNPC